jgi:bacteriophage N4 adsorption protein B
MPGLVEILILLCDWFFISVVVVTFLSGIDDLFIDLVYFFRVLPLRKAHKVYTEAELAAGPERAVAIMIPTWKEANVIARMLRTNIGALRYSNYHFFVGTYPNDSETRAAVAEVCAQFPHVHEVVGSVDGPTTKSGCLNAVYDAILQWERRHRVRFEIFVQHDSEDSIHPQSLRLFNLHVPEWDMVQLPVFSHPVQYPSGIGSHYLDEFAEHHQKGLPVRQFLAGSVPGAGVGCAFSRRALEGMSKLSVDGGLFRTDALTEDYDFAFRLVQAGFSSTFLLAAIRITESHLGTDLRLIRRVRDETICTSERFPEKLGRAIRQKSRWILGITLQGYRQLGWKGNAWMRYMLMRDRKALITAHVSLLSCLVLLGYMVPLPVPRQFWVEMLAIANFTLAVWRFVMRAYCVRSRYGAVAALWCIWGLLSGMFVAFCATSVAIWSWLNHRLRGRPLRWNKTDHVFPEEYTAACHRKLGDLLAESDQVTWDQLERALTIQRENHRPVGQILLDMGLLEEEELAEALGRQKRATDSWYRS